MKQFVKKQWEVLVAMVLLTAVYGFTVARTIYAFDSAELSAAAYTLGIVHSPGYPVYLLIAHLFTYLPFGDVAFRVNLFSAVSTIFATWLLIQIMIRLTNDKLVSAVAGLTFAFSFYVWSQSVIAEVYTLQILFLTGLISLLLYWHDTGKKHFLFFTAVLAGITFVNNPSTALWWPGLLWLGWTSPQRQQLTKRDWLFMTISFLIGFLPLIYLPIRSRAYPPLFYVGYYDQYAVFHPLDLSKLENLWWYLSGQQFESLFWGYTLPEFFDEIVTFSHQLLASFLGIGLPLGVYGFWYMARKRRRLLIGLSLIFFFHAFFFISYRTVDKETMFLPAYLIWSIFLVVGLQRAYKMLTHPFNYVIWLLPIGLIFVNFPYVDVYDFQDIRHTAQSRLENADHDAIYIAAWGDAAAMDYLQVVDELRGDVQVINVFFVNYTTKRKLIENALVQKQAVYMTHEDPFLNDFFLISPVEYGFQISAKE